MLFHSVLVFLFFSFQGPGALWCDIDIVEFTYFGVPNAAPREQTYAELVDGLRGMDPCIGAGTQVYLLPCQRVSPYSSGLIIFALNFGCQAHFSRKFQYNCYPEICESQMDLRLL